MQRLRFLGLASILIGLSIPTTALATSFQQITILPAAPVPADSPVSVWIEGTTTGGPGTNYEPISVSITGNTIDVTPNLTTACAISSGLCPEVEIDYTQEVSLGLLAPGTYDLSVEMLFTSASSETDLSPTTSSFGTRSLSFTVVPEPSTAILLGLGFSALAATRRR